jgi:hypothetical protein
MWRMVKLSGTGGAGWPTLACLLALNLMRGVMRGVMRGELAKCSLPAPPLAVLTVLAGQLCVSAKRITWANGFLAVSVFASDHVAEAVKRDSSGLLRLDPATPADSFACPSRSKSTGASTWVIFEENQRHFLRSTGSEEP